MHKSAETGIKKIRKSNRVHSLFSWTSDSLRAYTINEKEKKKIVFSKIVKCLKLQKICLIFNQFCVSKIAQWQDGLNQILGLPVRMPLKFLGLVSPQRYPDRTSLNSFYFLARLCITFQQNIYIFSLIVFRFQWRNNFKLELFFPQHCGNKKGKL